jgi:hypothetical protein
MVQDVWTLRVEREVCAFGLGSDVTQTAIRLAPWFLFGAAHPLVLLNRRAGVGKTASQTMQPPKPSLATSALAVVLPLYRLLRRVKLPKGEARLARLLSRVEPHHTRHTLKVVTGNRRMDILLTERRTHAQETFNSLSHWARTSACYGADAFLVYINLTLQQHFCFRHKL